MSPNSKVRSTIFTIRQATTADCAAIAALGHSVFASTFGHSMPPHDLEAYLDATYTTEHMLANLQDTSQTVLVATTPRNQLAGFLVIVRGSTDPSIASYPDTVELLRFYIDTPFHGSGVAHTLMEKGEAVARGEGFQTMWLGVWEENGRAQNFYRRWGYEPVGSHDFVTGETISRDLIMVKTL